MKVPDTALTLSQLSVGFLCTKLVFYNRKMTKTSNYSLLTLEKGLRVLELIADIGVSQLSEQLDESVTVTFRILRTLVGLGSVLA
jgi:IclR helix-turn-helix domain